MKWLPILFLAITESVLAAGALNPDVRQDNIDQTICVKGWTATVRPAVSYTNGVKFKLLREAGIPESQVGDFELDHIIPLALGGHPRKIANLTLQPWEVAGGAKKKDRLEAKMSCLVCAGQLPLAQAQQEIAEDWQSAYHRYSRLKCRR